MCRTTKLLLPVASIFIASFFAVLPSASQVGGNGSTDRAFRQPAETKAVRIAPKPASGRPCDGDRCHGQRMMGWTDQVAACAAGMRIGIVTSTIEAAHPALANVRLESRIFAPARPPSIPFSRGTALLGLLAGEPAGGVSGLIPRAEFLLADPFFATQAGQLEADAVSILQSLDWMRARNAQIVLLDVAGVKDDLVQQGITSLAKDGIIVVTPASDRAEERAYNDVLVVRAIEAGPSRDNTDRVDLFAPGTDIWTALPNAGHGFVSGNSFAAAHAVAAIAAIYPSLATNVPAQERAGRIVQSVFTHDIGSGRKLAMAPTACTAISATAAPPGRWPSTTTK